MIRLGEKASNRNDRQARMLATREVQIPLPQLAEVGTTWPMQITTRTPCAHANLLRLLCAACFLQTGCHQISRPTGLIEESPTASKLTSRQLRILVNDYVVRFSDQVERDSDRILAHTSDPTIRRNALRWKINGISSCFRAASRQDSLGAYLDVWVLNRQMQQLFTSPVGKQLFGNQQAIAQATCQSLEIQLRLMEKAIGGDLNIFDGVVVGADFVTSYAASHPIADLYFDRDLMGVEYVGQVQPASEELLDVVGNLENHLEDLERLSRLYAAHLPKQARWEAELLLLDAVQIESIAQPLREFSTATDSVVRLAATADALPQLVAQERQQLQQIVHAERLESFQELERMRGETIRALEQERELVLETLRQERSTVLETLHAERLAISRDGKAELAAALREADRISSQRTDEMAEEATRLVDYFFTRTHQLSLVIGLIALVLTSSWYLTTTRHRSTTDYQERLHLAFSKDTIEDSARQTGNEPEDSTAAA